MTNGVFKSSRNNAAVHAAVRVSAPFLHFKNEFSKLIILAAVLHFQIQLCVQNSESKLGTILGATRGGGSFTVTREMRSPEVDGKRYGNELQHLL